MIRKQCLLILCGLVITFTFACNEPEGVSKSDLADSLSKKDTIQLIQPVSVDSFLDQKDSLSSLIANDSLSLAPIPENETIPSAAINAEDVIRFAEGLVGTPYVYGSSDPEVGFDCSGFITYVFRHFKITVPRSSGQFKNIGKTIPVENARRGDIILFTDPGFDNSNSTEIGHVGLVTSNDKGIINFIHSTSGKAMSVAITPMSDHYKKRFVRVARVFPQNDQEGSNKVNQIPK
jgi:cell wall-associated NlpC family hydrolase